MLFAHMEHVCSWRNEVLWLQYSKAPRPDLSGDPLSALPWAAALCLVSHPEWGLSHTPKITWGSLWQSRDPCLCLSVPPSPTVLPTSGEQLSWDIPGSDIASPAGFKGPPGNEIAAKAISPAIPYLPQYHIFCNAISLKHGTRQKRFIPLFLLEKRGWESESFHANVTQLLLNCQNKWQKWGKWHQIKNVTGDRFMSSTVGAARAGERDTVITQH